MGMDWEIDASRVIKRWIGISFSLLFLMKPDRSVDERPIEGKMIKLWNELSGKVNHDGGGSIVVER